MMSLIRGTHSSIVHFTQVNFVQLKWYMSIEQLLKIMMMMMMMIKMQVIYFHLQNQLLFSF